MWRCNDEVFSTVKVGSKCFFLILWLWLWCCCVSDQWLNASHLSSLSKVSCSWQEYKLCLPPCNAVERTWPVPDPDLEIRGGRGPGHPDPYVRGEGGGGLVPPKNFLVLRASVWFKNRGGVAPRAPHLDPPLMAKLHILKLFDRDKILSEMLH